MIRIPERLDSLPLTRLHLAVALACSLALGVDLMEMSLGNALTAVFSAPPYNMDARHLSWLIAAVFAGAIIGAPLLGRLADRRGLKAVLVAALTWLAVTSLLAATSADSMWLMAMRFFSGLSLGALPPLIIAYLTAVAPARFRGVYIFWTCALGFLAGPAAVFSIRSLTPLHPWGVEGWRWPFAAAALMSLGASAVLAYLPESPRWLLAAAKVSSAAIAFDRFNSSRPLWGASKAQIPRAASSSDIDGPASMSSSPLSSTDARRRLLFLATIYFLQPASSLAFTLLTGPILLQRGYDLSKALLYVGVATFGPSVSTLVAGLFIDRIDRREALALCATVMLSAVAMFFALDTPIWAMLAVVLFGLAQGFYVPLMTTYGAEMFPTPLRASATSTAWSINRISSFLAPMIVFPILQVNGWQVTAVLIYVPLILSIALLLTYGPRGVAGGGVA
jgi:MFS transporter, putative metabolite:H+ symporter